MAENMGRPSIFTQDIADEICRRLTMGESLRGICRDDDMPDRQTVANWLTKYEDFFGQYTRARDVALDDMADEIMEIADDGSNDWMERHDKEGNSLGWYVNGEALGRSRLRFDARRWFLSKLAPKRYGDKLQHEHSGAVTVKTRIDLGGS